MHPQQGPRPLPQATAQAAGGKESGSPRTGPGSWQEGGGQGDAPGMSNSWRSSPSRSSCCSSKCWSLDLRGDRVSRRAQPDGEEGSSGPWAASHLYISSDSSRSSSCFSWMSRNQSTRSASSEGSAGRSRGWAWAGQGRTGRGRGQGPPPRGCWGCSGKGSAHPPRPPAGASPGPRPGAPGRPAAAGSAAPAAGSPPGARGRGAAAGEGA